MKHYAIMVSGYGRRAAYVLVEVMRGMTIPVSAPRSTERAAMADALAMGVEVSRVGGLWEII